MPETLPEKPSELITLALADLAVIESFPNDYAVDMDVWHKGPGAYCNKCVVCLAGSVMAVSLNASKNHTLAPSDFSPEERRAICAIDHFRDGRADAAFDYLGLPISSGRPFNREITPYHTSKELFRADMEKLASDLRAAGF